MAYAYVRNMLKQYCSAGYSSARTGPGGGHKQTDPLQIRAQAIPGDERPEGDSYSLTSIK